MLKRLNKVLPELILAILVYGILLQVTGVWLVEKKAFYSAGLWIGIFLAIGMAVHMAVVIEDAVSRGSGQGKIVAMSLLRYLAVVAVFFCTAYFRLGNPVSAFFGVMGLKIAAYAQPFFHKIISNRKGSEEGSADYKEKSKNREIKEVKT